MASWKTKKKFFYNGMGALRNAGSSAFQLQVTVEK